MGCQLTKSKKSSNASDQNNSRSSRTTQSTSSYQSEQYLQKPKKISKWIPINIPQLMLQESDLYRRRTKNII